MKYHYQIISKLDNNSIHTDTRDNINPGPFGDRFEGYEDERTAKYWARDRMVLLSLSDKDYYIKTISDLHEKTDTIIVVHKKYRTKKVVKRNRGDVWR